MKLDYQPGKGQFVLWAPHARADKLRIEHGLDISRPNSTDTQACLYTPEPYAAVAFAQWATSAAMGQLDPIAREIAASWRYEPTRFDWPDTLRPSAETPYPLQLANLEYAARRQHTLVGDEPGIGKTATALLYSNLLAWEPRHNRRRPDAFRCLVICPASIRRQWLANIRRWSTIPDVKISLVETATRGIPHTSCNIHFTVISYDGASTYTAAKAIVEQKCRYDLLVLDECQYLKEPTTGRARAILGAADRSNPIASCAAHIMALSGTPSPNRAREFYGLMHRLCPESIDYMSQRAFNNRFNPRAKRETDGGKVYVREEEGRGFELQARLRSFLMVRHQFHDAFPQLKLPIYDLIQVTETSRVKQALEAEKLLDIDPETLQGADNKFDGAVSTVRLQMGLALAPEAIKYIKMLHEGGGEKIVVFAWHREVMDLMQKGLDKFGVVRVDGRTTERDKERAVHAFQHDPHISIILGNVLSLGTGTDGLQQVARRVVLAEPDWVFGNNEQCIKRLYRSGQTGQVLADIIVAPGSIAERVLASALRKGRLIHRTTDERVEL